MSTEDMGTRIKGYEKKCELLIPYDEFVIIRIDGHKFSKFTKGFIKPFDKVLSDAMINTTISLVEHFGAVTGYTQSDEITLVFPPQFKELEGDILIDNVAGLELNETKIMNNQIYGGRTQKIASLVAGYTTLMFNNHLEKSIKDNLEDEEEFFSNSFRRTTEEDEFRKQKTIYLNKIGKAWFDARVFGVPSDDEALNVVMWRTRDCIKNSKSMFAQSYCSHKSLLNKNGVEQVEFCKETTGKDWELIEDKFKFGILVKRESYTKMTENGPVERTKIVTWAEALTTYSIEKVDMIVRKLKND